MAHSVALRPFGFSQPSRVTTKTKRRADTPIPADDSVRISRPSDAPPAYHKSKPKRVSLPSDSLGPYWTSPPTSQPRAVALRSGLSQRTFPDEEDDDAIYHPRHSRTREKRRPPRLQTSRHAQAPSVVSPMTPTAIKMLADMQLRAPPADLIPANEDFTEKQLEQQLKDVYLALRRVEAEREKVLSQMEAGRTDRYRVERELEETRRENRRLAARLEELLRNPMMKSPTMKSPLSARSDDAWGCSMYDMEAEGH